MKAAVDAAIEMESRPGILGISIMAGFSLADFTDAGMSVIVVADKKHAASDLIANQVADELQKMILTQANGFVYESTPIELALKRATAIASTPGKGPVLLLDHSDNVMSGGTCDTTDILEAALQFGLTNIATGPIADPATVKQLIAVGLDQEVTIELGNKSLNF